MVSEKNINRFFQEERKQVEEYNQQRLTLISKSEDLKNRIERWNAEERARWKDYVDASTKMAQEELNSFRLHAQQYSSKCNEQKEKIGAILLGFGKGQGK